MNKVLFSNDQGTISQCHVTDDMSLLIIESATCNAKVSLYGGQVLQWQPQGHEDVFWLSDKAIYEQGTAIRGGVPVCWPWFGAFPEGMDLMNHDPKEKISSHGFARVSLWQIEEIDVTAKGATIKLSISGENAHPAWPFKFELNQTLFFGESFSQTLSMKNISNEGKPSGQYANDRINTRSDTNNLLAQYTGALHSYFAVGAANDTKIENLTGVPFDDKIKISGQYEISEDKLSPVTSCEGPIDRIYSSNKDLLIVDKGNNRTIKLHAENTQQWVLWNPGIEIASSMKDVHLNGEKEFVCLEAANTELMSLPVGETVSISQHISVEHHVS